MANEIVHHNTTGLTLYAQVYNIVGQVYNGSTFEAPGSANWGNYDIAMSEAATATGVYRATFPGVAAGVYAVFIRKQAGGGPAVGDLVVGSGAMQWDGSAEIALNNMAVNAVQISGDSTAADRLEAVLDAAPSGAVVDDNDPDPTTTLFETNLGETTNDHYNGAFVVFTSGALLGQSRKISDYDGTTKVVTVATAFTEAPAAADTFIILGRSE